MANLGGPHPGWPPFPPPGNPLPGEPNKNLRYVNQCLDILHWLSPRGLMPIPAENHDNTEAKNRALSDYLVFLDRVMNALYWEVIHHKGWCEHHLPPGTPMPAMMQVKSLVYHRPVRFGHKKTRERFANLHWADPALGYNRRAQIIEDYATIDEAVRAFKVGQQSQFIFIQDWPARWEDTWFARHLNRADGPTLDVHDQIQNLYQNHHLTHANAFAVTIYKNRVRIYDPWFHEVHNPSTTGPNALKGGVRNLKDLAWGNLLRQFFAKLREKYHIEEMGTIMGGGLHGTFQYPNWHNVEMCTARLRDEAVRVFQKFATRKLPWRYPPVGNENGYPIRI